MMKLVSDLDTVPKPHSQVHLFVLKFASDEFTQNVTLNSSEYDWLSHLCFNIMNTVDNVSV